VNKWQPKDIKVLWLPRAVTLKYSHFSGILFQIKKDMAIALQEGTFAFHTVQHHQSFKSKDCSSGLIKKIL
jgi:hypothetical protein